MRKDSVMDCRGQRDRYRQGHRDPWAEGDGSVAAAGPFIRLNISSVPPAGTVMDVASAITTRNYSGLSQGPRCW
jgi:hypothetical protein